MQRQSLGGSPSSKLVPKDEQHLITTNEITQLNNNKQLFPLSISNNLSGFLLFPEEKCSLDEEEELKKKKKMRTSSSSGGRHETYIHIIPMLTLLCFLILYLSSHNPSQTDLAQFNGFKAFSNPAADLEDSISELQRVVEIKKGDILVVRSLKNFKPATAAEEEATAKHRRLHRKIARNL